MATTGQKSSKEIIDLVTRFQQNAYSYRNPSYGEAELRVEFVNPMFEALGWDVVNKAGYADAYKDVIHEDAIKVGGRSARAILSSQWLNLERKFLSLSST